MRMTLTMFVTAPRGDDLVRLDLLGRAHDLAQMLKALLPEEREVRGRPVAPLLVHQGPRETRPTGRR
jgi:RNA polymerase sigma-70 factor, ECF subfamily